MPRVYLGLGSNRGDRLRFLRRAVEHISRLPGVLVAEMSPVYETEPYGVADQEDFLNAVIGIETDIEPGQLGGMLREAERVIGRTASDRWGPREIDIDVLVYGAVHIETPDLTIPHPELQKRRFVLEPLAFLAPEVRPPGLGSNVRELLNRCPDQGRVQRTSFSLKKPE